MENLHVMILVVQLNDNLHEQVWCIQLMTSIELQRECFNFAQTPFLVSTNSSLFQKVSPSSFVTCRLICKRQHNPRTWSFHHFVPVCVGKLKFKRTSMDAAYCGMHTAQFLQTSCNVSGWCSSDVIYKWLAFMMINGGLFHQINSSEGMQA